MGGDARKINPSVFAPDQGASRTTLYEKGLRDIPGENRLLIHTSVRRSLGWVK